MSQLIISDLKVGYKKNEVIHGLNIEVNSGEARGTPWSKRSWKIYCLKTISGLLTPTEGSIRFNGDDIGGSSPADIVDRGIVHVPEGRRVFPGS